MTLKKDESKGMIFGVCSGIAKHFSIDPIIPRFIFVIAALAGFGAPILIYIIMALLMSKGE